MALPWSPRAAPRVLLSLVQAPKVKYVLLLVLMLLTVGGWAAIVEPSATDESAQVIRAPQIDWVRTADGWEQAAHLHSTPPADASLHPVVVAGFMTLSGVLVLLAPASHQRV